MNNKTLYWLLQFMGWSSFSLVNTVLLAQMEGFTSAVLMNAVYIAVTGIFVSHVVRKSLHAFGATDRIAQSSLAKQAAVLLVAAFIWELSIIVFHVNVTRFYSYDSITASATFFYYLYYLFVLFIWMLGYINIKSSQNLKKSELKELQASVALKEAELESLKWQINPHFLFNSLNSIRALVLENPESARKMITNLAALMRHTLQSEHNGLASLKEEVSLVDNYLSLEKIRFESRLNYTLKLDEALNDFSFPPLLLQTLVENGIKHGIATLPKGGDISLRAELNQQKVIITLLSSGVLKSDFEYGTGLKNTIDRLRLAFDDSATLVVRQYDDFNVETQVIIDKY